MQSNKVGINRTDTEVAMHKFLPLATIEKLVPLMEYLGVSEVARSPRGFLTAYRVARGHSNRLDSYWWRRREAFISRHLAQFRKRGEQLYGDATGLPTRRHLAMITWAFSPSPRSLKHFVENFRE